MLKLKESEKAELNQIMRNERNYERRQRAWIVLLAAKGYSSSTICQLIDWSTISIDFVIESYKKTKTV